MRSFTVTSHVYLKYFPVISILIEIVFVAKSLDVPDTSVQVPEAASMVFRGESETVCTKHNINNLNYNFTQTVLFKNIFFYQKIHQTFITLKREQK